MASRRNKKRFKFVLQLLILSQKQILGAKNVVAVWGVSTDPRKLVTSKISTETFYREFKSTNLITISLIYRPMSSKQTSVKPSLWAYRIADELGIVFVEA